MKKTILSSLVFLLIAATLAESVTITVHSDGTGDYPTIQAAIDAAVNGDTVLVTPGTYTGTGNRDIKVFSKAVTIRSIDPNDPNVVAATVIDCNGRETELHRAFYFFVEAYQPNFPPTVLAGLTITHGYAKKGGAILYVECLENSDRSGAGEITHCVITGNTAAGYEEGSYGGGIYCFEYSFGYHNHLRVTKCTITNNTADGGGGMYGVDGPITDCTISNNKARVNYSDDLNGGGGLLRCNGPITGCTIRGNISEGMMGGGGLLKCDGAIHDCNIVGNVVMCGDEDGGPLAAGGGGLFWCNGPISNCNIIGNIVAIKSFSGGGGLSYCGGPISNCIISGNSTRDWGGGLSECDGPVTNCLISGNSADYGGGGLSQCGGPVTNCLISGNLSRDDSGAGLICCDGAITNCTIVANRSLHEKCAGLAYCAGPVTNCIIWDNLRPGESQTDPQLNCPTVPTYCCIQNWTGEGEGNINANPCFINPGYWDPNGTEGTHFRDLVDDFWVQGDYHLRHSSRCIDNATNQPPGTLPAADLDGYLRFIDGDNNGTVTADMGAYEFQGAIFFCYAIGGPQPEPQTHPIVNFNDRPFTWQITESCPWLNVNPTSGLSAGQPAKAVLAVDVAGLTPGTYNCQLTINISSDVNGVQTVPVTLHVGIQRHVLAEYQTIQAAIDAALNGDMVIVAPGTYTGFGNRDLDFKGKTITVCGVNPYDPCTVAATVIDCKGTEAEPHRGFDFHSYENYAAAIKGLTITNGYDGYKPGSIITPRGTISCLMSSPTISNCMITLNKSENNGGAICCQNASPIITNCVFQKNSTFGWGGAIYCLRSSPVITNCDFTDNTAEASGGAICCRDESNLIITNCDFTDNSALGLRGGAIYCLGRSNLGITNSSFSNNFTFEGAAVFCSQSNLTINHSSFVDNIAEEEGGGIFCVADSNLIISNCLIAGNSAKSRGGIVCRESRLTINDCTIADNTGRWCGGVCCNDSDVDIVNSIIWDNSQPQVDRWQSSISVVYSDIQGGWVGTGNINADPCFAEPNSGDYHLLEDSPCINTGDPNYVPEPNETDLDGLPRVIGPCVDMGAYEFNHIPVANAGPDQTITPGSNGFAQVTLDGSASYDEDGDNLAYLWTWIIDGNTCDANGVNPTIELPVGVHTIQLTVTDGIDESEPDEVVITVAWPPIASQLLVAPRVINRDSHQPAILAMLRLPPGITKNQIDNTKPLMLFPGGIKSVRQHIFQSGKGPSARTNILAFFNKAALMAAVPDNGRIQLRVTGRLKTGQPFFGTDTVMIKGKEKDKDPKPPVPKK